MDKNKRIRIKPSTTIDDNAFKGFIKFLSPKIKLLRCYNETIEALSRYRRGGEQRVAVQHIADKIVVVNNFGGTGGGGSQENRGTSPCS